MTKESRKDKKARIRERNKRHHIVNLMAWEHEAQAESGMLEAPRVDPEKEREKSRERKRGEDEEEMVWSARVGKVRNRLTGKKRAAKERWNRFAGTSAGGGRGL